MDNSVTISGFTSVLEIVFAINFVFLFVEVKPLFEEGWREIARAFKDTQEQVWEKATLGRSDESFKLYVKLTGLEVFYYGIELTALVTTALLSMISVAWLIQAGFEPRYAVARCEFTGFLVFAFATVPAYYLLSHLVLALAKKQWVKSAQEILLNKTQKEDTDI